jgi:FlaA1/EpsC-like NDP-sugar epimerase
VLKNQAVRHAAQATIDAFMWVGAVILATAARYEFDLTGTPRSSILAIGALSATVGLLSGLALGLYEGRYVYGSFEQVRAVGLAAFVTTCVMLAVLSFQDNRIVPLGAMLMAGAGALALTLFVRTMVRTYRDRARRPAPGAAPVLVFGAGEAGQQIIRSIQRDRHSRYRVVGVLDDDPSKQRLRISGVPVVGTGSSLAEAAASRGAETLIVAVGRLGATTVADLAEQATAIGVDVKTIPTLAELVGEEVDYRNLRDLDVADVLRRDAIHTDLTGIHSMIRGRRVLITGAGGSIGSEIARQINQFGPSALGLLDRDESALHTLDLSLGRRGLFVEEGPILADLRDRDGIFSVMREFKPEIVFHAAALKHLPLLERFPHEALLTNIDGTLNVLDAARAVDVSVFVNISTDKAADPCSVLGYSKRITECLTAAAGAGTTGDYVSVRFGNVLGSRGSVLHAFAEQIDRGGPVTVTHPDVSRYFMTIPEAVQLVLHASTMSGNGSAHVLEMGEPVRIYDVARQLIARSGRDIPIQITGLRPGEKLAERLYGVNERPQETPHPLVASVAVPHLDRSHLGSLHACTTDVELVEALDLLVLELSTGIGCQEVELDASTLDGLAARPAPERRVSL